MIKSAIVLVVAVLLVAINAQATGVIDALKANLKDKLKPAYHSNHYPTSAYGSSPHYVESPDSLDAGYGTPYSGSRSHYSSPAYSSGVSANAAAAYDSPYGPSTHTAAGPYGGPARAYGGLGGYGASTGGYGHQRHLNRYDDYEAPELPYGYAKRNQHLHNPYLATGGYGSEYADYAGYDAAPMMHEPSPYMGGHSAYPGVRRPRFMDGSHQMAAPMSGGVGGSAASAAAAGAGGAAASASVAGAGETSPVESMMHHPEMMHGHAGGSGAAAAAAAASDLEMDAAFAMDNSPPHDHGFSETMSEHIEHEEPEINQAVSASAGTFTTDDKGVERTSYQRSTEHVQNEEKGHVDDDHYYNAQSYGKTHDDNLHEAFDKDDEDYEQTATGFRKKKRKENYVKTHNKATRETGSGVVAKDKHRAGFKKSSNKFIENVDQKTHREGAGILEKEDSNTSQNIDDEDEDFYNSDGLHAGHANTVSAVEAARGAGAAGAGAAAATAVAGPGGVASSASAASGGH